MSTQSLENEGATSSYESNLKKDDDKEEEQYDCPVCLQTCIHPVKLPCSHIFCYLCVKVLD